jgi:hypothetical protein
MGLRGQLSNLSRPLANLLDGLIRDQRKHIASAGDS